MNILLQTYKELLLGIKLGSSKGNTSVSKPLFLIALLDSISSGELTKNEIKLESPFLRHRFGRLYEYHNDSTKGYGVNFFLRPFFHLANSSFYHMVWKGTVEPCFKTTPTAAFLRERLMYAKLDDELWALLQDESHRAYLKNRIEEALLTQRKSY